MVRSPLKNFFVAATIFLALTMFAAPRTLRAQQPAPGQQLFPVDDSTFTEEENFDQLKLGLRSQGGQLAQLISRQAAAGNLFVLPTSVPSNASRSSGNNGHIDGGKNVQVNDPAIDNIQSFTGTRPFEESTQSETSIAADKNHVVVGYNSSAGEPIVQIGNSLFATQILLSGFSVSHDNGNTWKSGFVPPPVGSVLSFGDPSVGVDRAGNFYYASLGGDPVGNTVIMVNKSTDHGESFAPATIIRTDNGGDKEWLAVGRDPVISGRDNLYVTWTSFRATGAQLWFAKSTDGGNTWTSKLVFAPANGPIFTNQLSFSNPVVDPSNGRLYVPFLHFSQFDADFIRVLVSDDGGATFSFLSFNVPGAPDPTVYPNVTPGELTDCGANNGGFRNVLHQGPDLGGGRFGLARYRFATRLITQPAATVTNGRLFLAFQTSTSPFFGDPASGSEINLLYSPNGGVTWMPSLKVAASTLGDPQHIHPSITLVGDGSGVSIGYYVQQGDSKLRTDLTRVDVSGDSLIARAAGRLSNTSFDLTPSNNPFPIAGNPAFTTNYDRTIRACYNIGEYMSVTSTKDKVLAAWGDNRQSWTSPPTSPAAGPHAQADVVFTRGDQ